MANDEKTCFVISPIGKEESETRKRSDSVLRHIIKPAAEECGYTAVRADEIIKEIMRKACQYLSRRMKDED